MNEKIALCTGSGLDARSLISMCKLIALSPFPKGDVVMGLEK